ncbi:tRNA(Arg) A34 adenosine deaminase TadA [Rhizobium sp. PP-F2F-G48]|uniref:deaminase n=1 Tax=Rhizobium sp. PP-F2F-G48 TaxID=2135651 RepID=UPI00104EA2D2|nr:deaminase [Rhizobium sp. PP-F2F-G48]TCM55894.1 tRNA(Arg) A34 adenosine deaminase TadA [Rhizobium sp. PP-F2F-G48]
MMRTLEERMMAEALAEARAALDIGIFPVGAVLCVGEEIVGRAHKSMQSSELHHAEMNLFHRVFDGSRSFARTDGLALYTTLEPCIMCFGTLLHLPISRLVFAMEDAYGGCAAVRLDPSPSRHAARTIEIVGGTCREDARSLFRAFLDTTSENFWKKGGAPEFQAAVRSMHG